MAYYLSSAAQTPVLTVSHARFSYAYVALMNECDGATVFRDCQVVNGWFAVYPNGPWGYAFPIYLDNVLLAQMVCPFWGHNYVLYGVNVTADQCANFGLSQAGFTGFMTNCIFTTVPGGTSTLALDPSCVVLSSGAGVYQTVGQGNYYLANNSPYRNAGNPGIDAATLADLRTLTTHAPTLLTANFTGNTTLGPVTAPDSSPNLDVGYHYPILDYVWNNLTVSGTLTLTNGVAVGVLGSTGLTVNGNLVSQGTPTALNLLGSASLVQEGMGTRLGSLIGGNGTWQSLSLRFTALPMLGGSDLQSYGLVFAAQDLGQPGSGVFGNGGGLVLLQDCQLTGGGIVVGDFLYEDALTVTLFNNLFNRASLSFEAGDPGWLKLNYVNNLLHGGSVTFLYEIYATPEAPFTIFNNVFDNSAVTEEGFDPWGGGGGRGM